MDHIALGELKAALQKEHDTLVTELKGIADKNPSIQGDWIARPPQFEPVESASSGSLEQEADEVEEYEVRLEAEHSLESRLLEINRALERMEKGGYGICASCKKEIPLDRLKANPAAETHIEHSK